ncbi:MAG: addiction module protein [Planctomycetaceae bacterium]|nr:addiction module protein [Planctomycetaceae bacterium]
MDLKTVLTATDSWPVEDRIRLMHELWDRLVDRGYEPVLTEEQKAELDRRLAEDDAAPDDVVSWEEVKAQALARIRR